MIAQGVPICELLRLTIGFTLQIMLCLIMWYPKKNDVWFFRNLVFKSEGKHWITHSLVRDGMGNLHGMRDGMEVFTWTSWKNHTKYMGNIWEILYKWRFCPGKSDLGYDGFSSWPSMTSGLVETIRSLRLGLSRTGHALSWKNLQGPQKAQAVEMN